MNKDDVEQLKVVADILSFSESAVIDGRTTRE